MFDHFEFHPYHYATSHFDSSSSKFKMCCESIGLWLKRAHSHSVCCVCIVAHLGGCRICIATAMHGDAYSAGVILGSQSIPYISPVTNSRVYSSTFAFASFRSSAQDVCWTNMAVPLAINASVCICLLSHFVATRVTLPVVFDDTRTIMQLSRRRFWLPF